MLLQAVASPAAQRLEDPGTVPNFFNSITDPSIQLQKSSVLEAPMGLESLEVSGFQSRAR